MKRPMSMPVCCGDEATWVDNVPGKEYCYCRSCKQEVCEQIGIQEKEGYYSFLIDNISNITAILKAQGRVYPNTYSDPSGHKINVFTNICAGCGSSQSEIMATTAPGAIITPCLGPAAMAARRDGAGSYSTHTWSPGVTGACRGCAAHSAMFSSVSLDGPSCAAARPSSQGANTAQPSAALVVSNFDTHTWPLAGVFSPCCLTCNISMAAFNPGMNSGPPCSGGTP